MNKDNELEVSEKKETVTELLKESIALQKRLFHIGGWVIFLLLVIIVLLYIK